MCVLCGIRTQLFFNLTSNPVTIHISYSFTLSPPPFFTFNYQVQRIYEYHKLLMRLYSLTPKEHPDYHDLRYTITRVSTVRSCCYCHPCCYCFVNFIVAAAIFGIVDVDSPLELIQIVQVREQQLNHNQNELKLEQVQTRFPHHDLGLFQPLDVIEVGLSSIITAHVTYIHTYIHTFVHTHIRT